MSSATYLLLMSRRPQAGASPCSPCGCSRGCSCCRSPWSRAPSASGCRSRWPSPAWSCSSPSAPPSRSTASTRSSRASTTASRPDGTPVWQTIDRVDDYTRAVPAAPAGRPFRRSPTSRELGVRDTWSAAAPRLRAAAPRLARALGPRPRATAAPCALRLRSTRDAAVRQPARAHGGRQSHRERRRARRSAVATRRCSTAPRCAGAFDFYAPPPRGGRGHPATSPPARRVLLRAVDFTLRPAGRRRRPLPGPAGRHAARRHRRRDAHRDDAAPAARRGRVAERPRRGRAPSAG